MNKKVYFIMLALTSFMSTMCRADLYGACYFRWGYGGLECIDGVTETWCEIFIEENVSKIKEMEGSNAQGAKLIKWFPGQVCK